MTERTESKAQLLAFELKDAAWRDVEHLPVGEALRKRLKDATATAARIALPLPVVDPRAASFAVREHEAEYGDAQP